LPTCAGRSSRAKLPSQKKEPEKFNQAIDAVIKNAQDFYAVVLVGGDDHANQAAIIAEELKKRNIPVPIFAALKTVDNDTTARLLRGYCD